MPDTPSAPDTTAPLSVPVVHFERTPAQYRHWRLDVDGDIATLTLDVDEDGGLVPGYKLKLNSYDLGVDIELADALERIRFEHPCVRTVVLTSGKERMFCSGANIYMLGQSSHAWKVNFCKFTNETRNGMEHASRHSGIKFLAAVNGACAGGGYELALACDEILLVDDRSSAVSLPEVPLLGVLPGTGGLTRLTDKRRVRRDRADVFCTTQEGQRAERAKAWRLIDDYAKPASFAALTATRARALAASSDRPPQAQGIAWTPLEAMRTAQSLRYAHLKVDIDAQARTATLTLLAPTTPIAHRLEDIEAEGANWYPLAFARQLNDAILELRTNHLEIGTWLVRAEGELSAVAAMDEILLSCRAHWLVRETINYLDRVLARLEVSSRSIFALIDAGSCFAGTFFEVALAADRIYMLASEADDAPSILLTDINRGTFHLVNDLGRLEDRFAGDAPALEAALATVGEPLPALRAEALGLVTFAPDDIDWEEEIRLAIEERASLSPDALTGMEASLRFGRVENLATRIFGRLSAWQNWVFIRPNATGEEGALKLFGTGKRPRFDRRRV